MATFRFPVVIIDEDFRTSNDSYLGIQELARAIEATGLETVPVATYTDVALTIPNGNPIVCDAAGRCVIFLSPGVSYKFVVTTAAKRKSRRTW